VVNKKTMTIDSATAVELVNLVAGVLILAMTIYACRRFRWDICIGSSGIKIMGSKGYENEGSQDERGR
jgi:hypothetical protein